MFNTLSLKFKLLRGKINPFKIKPEFCLFDTTTTPQQSDQQIKAFFKEKNSLNKDYDIVRLETEDPNKCLGLKIGQYIEIQSQNNEKLKSYPISRIDDCGIIDLVLTNSQTNLQPDQEVFITGPFTKYLYEGFGNIQLQNDQTQDNQEQQTESQQQNKENNNEQVEKDKFNLKNVEFIGVICQDIHMTNLFSLVEGISTNSDKTHISMLHFCDNLDRATLLDEILWLKSEQKLDYKLILKTVDPTFQGLKGELNIDLLRDYLPPLNSQDQTAIFISGDNEFNSQTSQHLQELGYSTENLIQIDNVHEQKSKQQSQQQ